MKMKKIHKRLLIILSISLATAIISGIATFSMGAHYVYTQKQNYIDTPLEIKTVEYNEPITNLEVDNLLFDIVIKPSDTSKTTISYPNKDIKINLDNKTLSIKGTQKYFEKNKWINNFNFSSWNVSWPDSWNDDQSRPQIIVEIPNNLSSIEAGSNIGNFTAKNFSLNQISINNGIGNTVLDTIEVKEKLNIDSGIGTTSLSNISGNSKGNIKAGMGTLDFDNIKMESADIAGGMGSIRFTNIEIQDLDIDGGVGEISLSNAKIKRLTGSQGLGSVKIAPNCNIEKNDFDY